MNHTFTEQMGGSTRRGHGLGFLCGALAAGLLFFFSWGGAASWAEGEKDVLGLPELIKRAISMSPELAQKRSETAAARSDLAQAESAYFPQFDGKTIVGPVNDARRPEIIGSRITNPSPYLAVGGFGNLDSHRDPAPLHLRKVVEQQRSG